MTVVMWKARVHNKVRNFLWHWQINHGNGTNTVRKKNWIIIFLCVEVLNQPFVN